MGRRSRAVRRALSRLFHCAVRPGPIAVRLDRSSGDGRSIRRRFCPVVIQAASVVWLAAVERRSPGRADRGAVGGTKPSPDEGGGGGRGGGGVIERSPEEGGGGALVVVGALVAVG